MRVIAEGIISNTFAVEAFEPVWVDRTVSIRVGSRSTADGARHIIIFLGSQNITRRVVSIENRFVVMTVVLAQELIAI